MSSTTDTIKHDRLFLTDLDGTLLNAESTVSDESVSLINDAIARGALVSVATARTPATVVPLLRKLNLKLPLIVMTGAAMWDPLRQQFIEPKFIAPESIADIRQICQRHSINPFVYTISDNRLIHTYYNGTMSKREQSFIDERSHLPLKRVHIDHPDGLLNIPSTVLMFAIGEKERIFQCAEELREKSQSTVSAYLDIFNRKVAFLEVFAPGVSKASAMCRLMEICAARHATVFGDNLNDLAMMEAADHSVAVGNAFDIVKQSASETIGPNTSDAVARYISTHIQ